MNGIPSTNTGPEWADGDVSHVPFNIYSDPAIFKKEMDRIFFGSSWCYVGLVSEIPEPQDYKTTYIGNRSVIICRDKAGNINGFSNRCAHRGVKFCKQQKGNTRVFICPYHKWVYDLEGNLKGIPFSRGVKGNGGMPEDFDFKANGLHKLAIHIQNGVIFASFDENMSDFEEYLGESNLHYFNRVFDGRGLRILGYSRQLIPANWKLMFENIKDPYHASLLHVFLVTFGLFRADQESKVKMDDTGMHGLLISQKGEQKKTADTKDMKALKENFRLKDSRLLDPVKEFPDTTTVVMQTIWPNVIIQQQSNTLAIRQLRPRDSQSFELHWTFFAYDDDDEEMVRRRLRQANLMSSAGLVSGDDSEVLKMAQEGVTEYIEDQAILRMGGDSTHDEEHMVTEAAIRAFYKHYRKVMGL